jgi:hypothetical protein
MRPEVASSAVLFAELQRRLGVNEWDVACGVSMLDGK